LEVQSPVVTFGGNVRTAGSHGDPETSSPPHNVGQGRSYGPGRRGKRCSSSFTTPPPPTTVAGSDATHARPGTHPPVAIPSGGTVHAVWDPPPTHLPIPPSTLPAPIPALFHKTGNVPLRSSFPASRYSQSAKMCRLGWIGRAKLPLSVPKMCRLGWIGHAKLPLRVPKMCRLGWIGHSKLPLSVQRCVG